MAAKGNTGKHVELVLSRAERIISECRFVVWSDISASRVQKCLLNLRDVDGGIGAQTSNFYLQAIRQFCNLMVQNRRARENSLAHLRGLNVKTDRRHDRRPLSVDELRRLLETTRNTPKRYRMTGPERAMLYRLAVESGLRAGELMSLKVASFNWDACEVTVQAAASKHRQQDVIPLRPDTAAELRTLLAGKLPGARAFDLPTKHRMAAMLRADLLDAGIDYVDENGRYADFHALRHTTGSLLAAAGVNPKTAQELMRHSDINLTMSRYSHVYRGATADTVEKLPDLSEPSRERQEAVATGTDGAETDCKSPENVLASCLALRDGSGRISADANGQPEHVLTGEVSGSEPAPCGQERGFSPENGDKRRGRDSNPGYRRIPVRRFSKPLP